MGNNAFTFEIYMQSFYVSLPEYRSTIMQMKYFYNIERAVANKIMTKFDSHFREILEYQVYISFLRWTSASCRNFWSVKAGKMPVASPSCSSY